MATYKVCKKCNQVAEMIKKIEHEGGYENIYYICSKCGYVDKSSINHVHYGNDGIK